MQTVPNRTKLWWKRSFSPWWVVIYEWSVLTFLSVFQWPPQLRWDGSLHSVHVPERETETSITCQSFMINQSIQLSAAILTSTVRLHWRLWCIEFQRQTSRSWAHVRNMSLDGWDAKPHSSSVWPWTHHNTNNFRTWPHHNTNNLRTWTYSNTKTLRAWTHHSKKQTDPEHITTQTYWEPEHITTDTKWEPEHITTQTYIEPEHITGQRYDCFIKTHLDLNKETIIEGSSQDEITGRSNQKLLPLPLRHSSDSSVLIWDLWTNTRVTWVMYQLGWN